jgi:hypothetical protein
MWAPAMPAAATMRHGAQPKHQQANAIRDA